MKYGKTRLFSQESYVLEASDFARVVCMADSGSWSGIVIGIRDTVKVPVENSNYPLFNVFVLGFDSLSRLAFMRKLPKSYEYLTKNLTGLVLKGYNIVGDGTPQAIIPILTGKTELELPDTRKRKFKSDFVNVYPFIWDEYKKHGYMTAYNEDLPTTGIFTYRLNGFQKQPTDHYMRTYYVEQENYKHYKEFCISNSPSHQIFLDYSRSVSFGNIIFHKVKSFFCSSWRSTLRIQSLGSVFMENCPMIPSTKLKFLMRISCCL